MDTVNERCGVCDQDAYHQNDWHCSQGLIGPKRKEWFDVKEEDPEDMKTISWVAINSKFIDFSQNAMNRANEPDTEPESDTDTECVNCDRCYKKIPYETEITVRTKRNTFFYCVGCYEAEEKAEKEEELIECHDCGTMSQLFYKHQGVSVGGVVYDISIGKCCEKHY